MLRHIHYSGVCWCHAAGVLAAAVTVTVQGQAQEECAQSRHYSRHRQPRNVPAAPKHTGSAAVGNTVGIYKPASPVINYSLPVCTAASTSLLLTGYCLDRLHVLTQECPNANGGIFEKVQRPTLLMFSSDTLLIFTKLRTVIYLTFL